MANKRIPASAPLAALLLLALGVVAWFAWLAPAADDLDAAELTRGGGPPTDRPRESSLVLDAPAAPSDVRGGPSDRQREEVSDDARLELAGAHWVEGRVVFPEGTPIDEEVEIVAEGKDLPGIGDYRARVGRDGRFRVAFSPSTQVGRLELEARHLFLEPAHKLKLPAKAPVELTPVLGGAIQGRIVPPAGAADADLRASKAVPSAVSWGETEGVLRRTAVVRDDLSYELRGLPANRSHTIEFDPRIWVRTSKSDLQVKPGEVLRLDLECLRGARLRGRVVDASGRPLAGAAVGCQFEYVEGQDWSAPRHGTTDDSGAFELMGIAPGKVKLVAKLKGFRDAERALEDLRDGEVREGLDLILLSGGSLSGVVRWSDGRAAAGAFVQVVSAAAPAQFFFSGEAQKCGPDGRFSISGLDEGPYNVHAHAKEAPRAENDALPARSKSRGANWRAQAFAVESGAELELVLLPGGRLAGQVVDDLGLPITKFAIDASPVQPTTGADLHVGGKFEAEDGRFEIEGLNDGKWNLTARARGYMTRPPMELEYPSASGPLVIVLPRGASLRGFVVDAAGKPVPKAKVNVESAEESGDSSASFLDTDRRSTADSKGAFRIASAPSGAIKVMATHERFAPSAPVQIVLAPGAAYEGLQIVMTSGGAIRGSLAPRLLSNGERWTVSVQAVDGSHWRDAHPDAQGVFLVERLAPGEYEVSANLHNRSSNDDGETPGFVERRRLAAKVLVVEGRTSEVALDAPLGVMVAVSGRVTMGVQPLARATVRAEGADDYSVVARTGEDGEYSLVLESSGRHSFTVSSPRGDANLSRNVDLAGVASARVDFEFPAGRVAGRVVDVAGRPVADATVRLERSRGLARRHEHVERTSRTDTAGAFEIEGLPAGEFRLTVLDEAGWGSRPKRFALTVVDGIELAEGEARGGLEVRVDAPGTLTCTVLTSSGGPAVGAEVIVMLCDDSNVTLEREQRRTDGAGRATFGGLGNGAHRVIARAGGEIARSRSTVQVTAGASVSTELTLQHGGWLTLAPVDASGAPAAASSELLDESGWSWSVGAGGDVLEWSRDSEQGASTVGPLPPGVYRATAIAGDQRSAQARVRVTSGGRETVRLELTSK